jgi:DNA polymerase III subunit epsilon
MKLAFDTETTGLWQYGKPATHPSQPRCVQLGAILAEDNGLVRGEINLIIKPDGWTIPKEASDVHGITTEIAEQFGVPIVLALNLFNRFSIMADTLIAHNYSYDDGVLKGEFARIDREPEFVKKNNFCTMKASTDIVAIKGPRGNKWPKLQEIHKFLFGEEFEGAHDAMADVRACLRVFFELKKRAEVKA